MKKVVFDACFLSSAFGKTLPDKESAYKKLIDDLEKDGVQIIIPAPAFSEFLMGIEKDLTEFTKIFEGKKNFKIKSFDTKAALECSFLLKDLMKNKDIKKNFSKQKIKYDYQIVSIAKIFEAECVYSDDKDVMKLCSRLGLLCRDFNSLEPPTEPELLLVGIHQSSVRNKT